MELFSHINEKKGNITCYSTSIAYMELIEHVFKDVSRLKPSLCCYVLAGINRLSYFLGRDVVDVLKCGVFGFAFTSAFVCLANPTGSFGAHFGLSMYMSHCKCAQF